MQRYYDKGWGQGWEWQGKYVREWEGNGNKDVGDRGSHNLYPPRADTSIGGAQDHTCETPLIGS